MAKTVIDSRYSKGEIVKEWNSGKLTVKIVCEGNKNER